MRKFYFTCIAVLLASSSYSQEVLAKITDSYFRSDPFASEFSSFVQHLLKDPTLTGTELKKRTDTSLFYFHGTYKTHSPFFFKPKRVEVSLSEASIRLNRDSVKADTIYLYELVAYNDYTETGIKEIKREFEKIHKRYKNAFYKNALTEDTATNSDMHWAVYNFFSPSHFIAPFSVSWMGPDENKEISLVLTIRIDNRDNRTILPISFKTL